MYYCSRCGASLPEGTKFCPECGTPAMSSVVPVTDAAPPLQTGKKSKPRKKSLFKRWWFWVLVIAAAFYVSGRTNIRELIPSVPKKIAASVPSLPAATARPVQTANPSEAAAPAASPSPAPASTPVPAEKPSPANGIRPEVKDYLDSYEAFMDEYVEFMQKYSNADAASMITMLGSYTKILARYQEFAEKIDAMEQEDLSNAEMAYYIEVTSRVSQKLLTAVG